MTLIPPEFDFMSLFTALREGHYARSSKARRSLGRTWASPSRDIRTRTISLVEMLETRQLLTAVVTTDLLDYAPGSTAILNTTTDGGPDHNYLVGETVQFQVARTDGI